MRIFDPRNEYGDELLTKDVAQTKYMLKGAIPDDALTKTEASNTYATKTTLSNNYLTTSNANNTYATISSLGSYMPTSIASSQFITTSSASNSYLSKSSASNTYETKSEATNVFAISSDIEKLASKSDCVENSRMVEITSKITKTIIDNAVTISTSDIEDIENWNIYNVELKLSDNSTVQLMFDPVFSDDGITLTLGDGSRSLSFITEVYVYLKKNEAYDVSMA